MGDQLAADVVEDFVTGVGIKRINHLQAMKSYFADLEEEYDFFLQLHNKEVKTNSGTFKYKLVGSYAALEEVITNEPDSIAVVLCIEGAHSFNTGLSHYVEAWQLDKQQVFENLQKVKSWAYRPFYITLTHHFNNDICGHAKSLVPALDGLIDQGYRMNEGFTSLGYEVADRLLDGSSGRILIDIKHMSVASRQDYYRYLDAHWASENIPLLVSHGALNGRNDFSNNNVVFRETAAGLSTSAINFYDDELLKIARSGGLFCLQLDERHIANSEVQHSVSGHFSRKEILFHRSRLFWNNIRHMAEALNAHDIDPWNFIALGSDFDGIINPLSGVWSAEEVPSLAEVLQQHVQHYLESKSCPIQKSFILDPEQVVNKVMGGNALNFMKEHFH